MSIVNGTIQVAYKTEADWIAWNGIPLSGQICYSNDQYYGITNCPKFKVGNGVDTWSNLDYHPAGNIADADYGDITVSNAGATWTIDNQVVTFSKMQHISTQKLLGRHTNGNGDIQEIGLDGGVEFQGGNLKAKVTNSVEISNQNIQLKNDAASPGNSHYYGTDAGGTKGYHVLPTDTGITQLTGDVTAGAGSGSQIATIANDAVTFAKMQNIATDRLLGRDTTNSGDVEELTVGGGIEFTTTGGIQTSALTGDVTKSAGGTATTLATVNSNVGSFTNASITVNAKGLVTAASSGATVPSTTQTDFISGLIEIPTDTTYKIVVKIPYAITITETTTISASGTCTATFKINTTALGGTANSVSNSEQSQTHNSSNAAAAGDDIQITVSSNSSCSFMSFTISFTRTLA